MAWQKRNYRKKGFKKTYKKKYNNGTSIAMKALKLAKNLNRRVATEYKFTTEELLNGGTTTLGEINPLTTMTQGDSENQRIGNSVKLIRISGKINIRLEDEEHSGNIRLVLFRGKNENRELYSPGSLTDPQFGILNDVVAPLYLARKEEDNKYHTKFIYDKTYTLNDGGIRNRTIDWNFRLDGYTQFTDGANTIENGGLYLMIIGDVTNTIVYTYNFKISFTDS